MPITSLTSYLNTTSFGDSNASTRNQQELALTLDAAARQLADCKGLALMSAGGAAFEVGQLLATTLLSTLPVLSAIPLFTKVFTFASGVTADTAFTTFLSQIFGEPGGNNESFWQRVLDQGSVRGMNLLGMGQSFAVMQVLTGLASVSGGMLCKENPSPACARGSAAFGWNGAFLPSIIQGLRCHLGSGAFGVLSGGVVSAVERRISLRTKNTNVGANFDLTKTLSEGFAVLNGRLGLNPLVEKGLPLLSTPGGASPPFSHGTASVAEAEVLADGRISSGYTADPSLLRLGIVPPPFPFLKGGIAPEKLEREKTLLKEIETQAVPEQLRRLDALGILYRLNLSGGGREGIRWMMGTQAQVQKQIKDQNLYYQFAERTPDGKGVIKIPYGMQCPFTLSFPQGLERPSVLSIGKKDPFGIYTEAYYHIPSLRFNEGRVSAQKISDYRKKEWLDRSSYPSIRIARDSRGFLFAIRDAHLLITAQQKGWDYILGKFDRSYRITRAYELGEVQEVPHAQFSFHNNKLYPTLLDAVGADCPFLAGQENVYVDAVEAYAKRMLEGKWDWDKMVEINDVTDSTHYCPIGIGVTPSGKRKITNGHHRYIAARITRTPIPASAFRYTKFLNEAEAQNTWEWNQVYWSFVDVHENHPILEAGE